MREIKFRAWDKKYKVMDDDFLIDCDGKIWDAPRMTYDTPNREIAREDDDRFILMQFTGLHDKNGKEIYEGDKYLWKGEKGVIVWDRGSFWCKPESPHDAIWDRLYLFIDEIEVTGNIYEDEELLSGT